MKHECDGGGNGGGGGGGVVVMAVVVLTTIMFIITPHRKPILELPQHMRYVWNTCVHEELSKIVHTLLANKGTTVTS
jgi:hypothetical protein